ncbi:MAG: HlyD family efflux transporter periplasmic adaptor subunit [Lentisphaerota bacterium]
MKTTIGNAGMIKIWKVERFLSTLHPSIPPLLLSLPLALFLPGCVFEKTGPDGSGTIECTQVQVSPQVSGRIISLPPQEGAVLKKGDLVAELDPVDYQIKRDESAAALGVAQAQLDLLMAGSRTEDVQRARDQVSEAKAMAQAAQADVQRIKMVFDNGTATQKQMDDARAQADRTAAALAGAEQNLAKLEAGSRKEEIRMAEAQNEQAKARLAAMEKAIRDCTITAPMDGVVTTRAREEGEFVNPGTTLVTLSRLDEVWLSVYIPEPRLSKVKLGQKARVKADGDSTLYEGVITFISPEAEFTPRNVQTPDERAKLVYRVKITLKNPNGVFKPGMPADGFIEGN